MTLRGFITYTVPFIVKLTFLGLIHEMGHLLTLLILGLRAELGWAWYSLFVFNTTTTKLQLIVVAYGGLLAVLFGYYLCREEEGQDRLEWVTVTCGVLGYSLVEILYFILV